VIESASDAECGRTPGTQQIKIYGVTRTLESVDLSIPCDDRGITGVSVLKSPAPNVPVSGFVIGEKQPTGTPSAPLGRLEARSDRK